MKSLMLFSGLMLSVSAIASPVQVIMNPGQTLEVHIQGCASDEYGYLDQTRTAICKDKICEYRGYWAIFGGARAEIVLLPSKEVLGTYQTKAEAQADLKKFIAAGLCKKSKTYVPRL